MISKYFLSFRFQTHVISVAHDNEHRFFNMSVTVRFVILVVVVVVVVSVVYGCCQEVWSDVFLIRFKSYLPELNPITGSSLRNSLNETMNL